MPLIFDAMYAADDKCKRKTKQKSNDDCGWYGAFHFRGETFRDAVYHPQAEKGVYRKKSRAGGSLNQQKNITSTEEWMVAALIASPPNPVRTKPITTMFLIPAVLVLGRNLLK